MIVLDTHALVWWASGDARLSKTASKEIEAAIGAGDRVLISAISIWEVAMLVERGRLALTMDLDEWLNAVAGLEGVEIVPVSAAVAVRSVTLPGPFHKDPADRMIVALARERNAPLVSADDKIQSYPHIRWIW